MKAFKYALFTAMLFFSANYTFAQSEQNTQSEQNETVGEVITINKEDFLNKIYNYEKNKDTLIYEGSLPCIVDFYADWCPPCKKVAPVLEELAKEYKGKVLFYKINTDKNKDVAMAFGARSIPMFLFIPANGAPQSAAGALPRETFIEIIDTYLLK